MESPFGNHCLAARPVPLPCGYHQGRRVARVRSRLWVSFFRFLFLYFSLFFFIFLYFDFFYDFLSTYRDDLYFFFYIFFGDDST